MIRYEAQMIEALYRFVLLHSFEQHVLLNRRIVIIILYIANKSEKDTLSRI